LRIAAAPHTHDWGKKKKRALTVLSGSIPNLPPCALLVLDPPARADLEPVRYYRFLFPRTLIHPWKVIYSHGEPCSVAPPASLVPRPRAPADAQSSPTARARDAPAGPVIAHQRLRVRVQQGERFDFFSVCWLAASPACPRASVGCQMGSRLTYACQEEHLCVRQMRSRFGGEEMWDW